MGLYGTFATDGDLEKTGVWFDYGDFRVLAGFSGGSNKKYTAYAEKMFKPLRRAIDTGSLGNERSLSVLIEVFSHTIIFNWETKQKDESGIEHWVQGIENKEGDLIEFTKENVIITFTALPNLFADIQSQCAMISNYRNRDLEEESKNS